MQNPLMPALNQLVDFQKVDAQAMQEAAQSTIGQIEARLQSIYHLPAEQRTFENTLRAYDDIINQLSVTSSLLYLLMSVSPQAALREQGRLCVEQLEKFGNRLAMDEALYHAVKAFAQQPEAQHLAAWQQKFLDESLRDFERNGLGLPAEERAQLKALQDRLAEVGNQFYRNIAEYKDALLATEAEVDGLPHDYKQARQNPDGTYTISLDYPSYQPFMQYSHSNEARKQLYIKFLNRAANKNLSVLDEMLLIRRQVAELLGYPSYAAYRQEVLMAKQPATVWDFEKQLHAQVRPRAQADYQELLEVKREKTLNPDAATVDPWESGYYRTILLREKYSVDPEQVKEFFPIDNVLDGLFNICEQLFGIGFTEVKDAPLWHTDARYFEVREQGQVVGRLYLDLYPREGKYNHAACFPMVGGCQTSEGQQWPVLALICNFSAPTAERPALLRHGEVETMFHEFGHALHCLLSRSPLATYAGTNTARDFVEVPSQLFEHWAWHYDSVKLFARHYRTGETLPRELFDKMLAAKNLGVGLHTQQQIFYGSYDLCLHEGYAPENGQSSTDLLRQMQGELTMSPYVEGTHFQAAFGHLNGYAASYYSYLWSLVYAEDMFSAFEANGLLHRPTGLHYRETVLSKGGSQDEMQQIVAFLGREPQSETFIDSLSVA